MAPNESSFNRKKANYVQRRRNKFKQRAAPHSAEGKWTIDSKKARQMKLAASKQKRKDGKLALKKALKMEVDSE